MYERTKVINTSCLYEKKKSEIKLLLSHGSSWSCLGGAMSKQTLDLDYNWVL